MVRYNAQGLEEQKMRGIVILAAAGAVWVLVVGVAPLHRLKMPRIRVRVMFLAIASGLLGTVVAFGALGTPLVSFFQPE